MTHESDRAARHHGRTAALLAFALIAGCSGTPAAFGTKYPDNRDHDIELLLQRINAAKERPAGTIAVAITAAPTQLYAFDFASRRLLWQRRVEARSAPFVAGDAVLVESDDEVLGFDLHSGTPRFRFERGSMSIKGADGEGRTCAVVIGEGQGTFAKSELVLVQDDGVAWRRPVDKLAGAPAVVGSTVLVPWANQFLSALDVQNGREFARVRVRDGVIAHALREGQYVYVGSFHGITRVTSSIGSGTLKGAGYFALPQRDLPGRPLLLSDVYTQLSAPPPDSAQHRIGLTWRPVALDHVRIGLEDGNLYLVFYRFVFALDPSDYRTRWVYVHDADIVGAAAQTGGVAIADEAGRYAFVGANSGQALWKEDTRLPSVVARLPRAGAGAADVGPRLDPKGLPAQLLAAALDPDARLVPARLLAVDELARLDQAEATADLIELCDSHRVAPPVRDRACAKLKDRSIGADHLLAALERHAGYLEGTTSPPVGALAKAAASLKEARAVPLLIAHLKDPNTRSTDLPALVTALGELGDAAAAEPLADFFRLYHADPIDEHLVTALELIPGVLVKLSGPVAMPVLEHVAYDALGTYSVRQKASGALDALAAQQQAAQQSDDAEQLEQAQQAAEQAEEANPDKFLPTHLTTDMITQALLPVRDPLRRCLEQASQPTFNARVVLVLEEGQAIMVSVVPTELQGCVEPLIRAQKFPRTRIPKREQMSYTIKR